VFYCATLWVVLGRPKNAHRIVLAFPPWIHFLKFPREYFARGVGVSVFCASISYFYIIECVVKARRGLWKQATTLELLGSA